MAKEEVLLISPNFVRETTNISSNMQDKFCMAAIREATDVDLEEVVGSKMLSKLKNLVRNGNISDEENSHYKDVLDKAKYFLAYSVVTRLVVISSIKLDNIGANVTSDENAQPLEVDDVFRVEQYYRNKADYYKDKLQRFLHKNISLYPELTSVEWDDKYADLYSSASTSIFLGGARGKGTYFNGRLADKYENYI